jgi:hypothetical protein
MRKHREESIDQPQEVVLRVDIPEFNPPIALTSGWHADIVASQRARQEYIGNWEKAIKEQYDCPQGQRHAIFMALVGDGSGVQTKGSNPRNHHALRNDIGMNMIASQSTNALVCRGRELTLIGLPSVKDVLANGWYLYDCPFNRRRAVVESVSRIDWEASEGAVCGEYKQ